MMQVMLLIHSDPALRPKHGTAEFGALMQGYAALGAKLRADGAFVSGDALKPAETARTLRGGGGGTPMWMDGPIAETREHLGGYYLIEVPDMAAAQAYAAMIPTVDHGAVEMRQLAGFGL